MERKPLPSEGFETNTHFIALGNLVHCLHEMRLKDPLVAVGAAVQRGLPESPVYAGVFPGKRWGGGWAGLVRNKSGRERTSAIGCCTDRGRGGRRAKGYCTNKCSVAVVSTGHFEGLLFQRLRAIARVVTYIRAFSVI